MNLDAAAHLTPGVPATMEDERTVNWSSLISAIAPILVLVLGFVAGKRHSFDADRARGFSRLALTYALPANIFLSAYLSGIRDSSQWLI